MKLAHQIVPSSTILEVGTPPPSSQRAPVKPFQCKVLFHRFKGLSNERGKCISSPEFEYNGRNWCVNLYPRGNTEASEGYVSVFLKMCSKGSCTATWEIKVEAIESTLPLGLADLLFWEKSTNTFDNETSQYGWDDFVKRSRITKKSRNLLDCFGTLAVVVSIQEEDELSSVKPFVPKNDFNSMMRGLFLDEDTADVCFEVGTTQMFLAHRLVLKKCAPMLSTLFNSSNTLEGDEMARAVITDVKPEVFRLLLASVYGRSMAEDDMKTHVKDIIDAADKYSIVNLKLEAEAAYVKSTKITMENAMDNLLYADALNLALLKEAVMDFLAENHVEAVKKVSFTDVPGHLMKDLLVAFGMSKKEGKGNEMKEDFDVMRVSELRVKVDKMGLDVDGSREAMIEALRKSSKQS